MLTDVQRIERLAPPADRVRVVIDSDTFNEIDDQFAIAYALLSPQRLDVQAIYAAPFHNERSSGPEDGMRKSHAEILKLLERLGRDPAGLVQPGATRWLDPDKPQRTAAVDDLIRRAGDGQGRLHVVAIGAITNIAAALRIEPSLAERIVVLWLGGHPTAWHSCREFNLCGDLTAAQVVFDSGVPMVLFPCRNVAEHLRTTLAEIERYVRGRGRIGDFLYETVRDCVGDTVAYSRVIWDLAPVAWLVDPTWFDSMLRPCPRPTSSFTWDCNPHRPLIREVIGLNRDRIFRDLFTKLDAAASATGGRA